MPLLKLNVNSATGHYNETNELSHTFYTIFLYDQYPQVHLESSVSHISLRFSDIYFLCISYLTHATYMSHLTFLY
jgi:hypothetical protein